MASSTTVTISFRASHSLKRKVKTEAKRRGIKESDYCRLVVTQAIAQDQGGKKADEKVAPQ